MGASDHHVSREGLELFVSELDRTWPDAAGSLREGMHDTLTLMRRGIDGELAKTLSSTNPCESLIEIARYTQRTKRWQDGWACANAGPPPGCSSPRAPVIV